MRVGSGIAINNDNGKKKLNELNLDMDKPLPVKIAPDWQKLPSVYYKEYDSGDITIKKRNILVNTNHRHLEELLSKKKTITTKDEDLKVHRSARSLILLFLSEHPRYRNRVTLERGKFKRYVVKVLNIYPQPSNSNRSQGDENELERGEER